MRIWSKLFVEDITAQDILTCAVDVDQWRRLTEENEGAKRIFARIEFGGHTLYAALGAPIYTQEGAGAATDTLYLPSPMLQRLGIEGMGQEAEVTWLWEDAFPEATRIKLRPHSSAFYDADAKADLERALTRVGVLEAGTTITLPLEGLGGLEVEFDVVELEPAHIVLADGEEVAMEFEEAVDAAAARRSQEEMAAAAAAEAAAVAAVEPSVAASPDPLEYRNTTYWSTVGAGQALGGATKRAADGRPWNPWRA
jgi:hypothetical protein